MIPDSYGSPELKELGLRIRRLRMQQKLSQAQLAESLGISSRYLGEVEAGKRNVSFGILSALSHRLSIPLPELVDFTAEDTRTEAICQINMALEKMPLANILLLKRIILQFLI